MTGYSQFGEDLAVSRLFPRDYVGSYLDVGAGEPVVGSNTYHFYERGWRGLLVDPVPGHCRTARAVRPGDRVLECAVADHDGEAAFYENRVAATCSTMLPGEAAKFGHGPKSYATPVKTLATVVEEFGLWPPPDLLSIDVEGAERAVLEGTPFERGWRPAVLIVEACLPRTETPSHREWEHILDAAGYEFRERTGVNRIYRMRP